MNGNGQRHTQPDWQLAGQRAAEALPDAAPRASLAAFLAESASLAPQIMLFALLRSEFACEPGWQIEERSRALRLDPCFTPLLARWHQLLLAEGWLEQDQHGWLLADCAPGLAALEQRIDDNRHRLRQLLSWLDDGAALAAALFDGQHQLDEWLAAPLLVPAARPGLHQLWQQQGMLAGWFSAIVAAVVPPLLAESGGEDDDKHGLPPLLIGCRQTLPFSQPLPVQDVTVDLQQPLAEQLPARQRYHGLLASGLLGQPDSSVLLRQLSRHLRPGAPLLLLENTLERPLHWVTPAALNAQAAGQSHCPFSGAADLQQCRQQLVQAGFELLASWPQPDSPMAFCGQRLLVARLTSVPSAH